MMYRRNGCGSGASVCFLGLEFHEVRQCEPGRFSATLHLPWGRQQQVHALTLDFDQASLGCLLACLPDGQRNDLARRLAQTVSAPVALPLRLRARVVECRAGQPRQLTDGTLVVPFEVLRIDAGAPVELAA